MTPAEKLELSDQARRIIDQQRSAIAAELDEARARATSPSAALEAACTLLNQRGRYSGVTGEHFDRQDYEGIQIIDALDEQVLRAVRALLKSFVDRFKKTPELETLKLLSEQLLESLRELPPYPVAYMVVGAIHTALAGFQKLAADRPAQELAGLEHALVHVLLGLSDRYVQTRERPLERHHSDIMREYVVVRRMRCPCGEEKYDVATQALCHTAKGEPYDRLDLQCRACGARRSVTFDLPNFKDLERM